MPKEVQEPSQVRPPQNAGVVTQPKPSEVINAAPDKPKEADHEAPVRFLRNSGPVSEIIVFKDNQPYHFPTYSEKILFPEKDKEVIEKIRDVARKFHIYEDRKS